MYWTSSMSESWKSQTATPPTASAAISAKRPSGRLSPMRATLSPRSRPRATKPSAISFTASTYSRHVIGRQMPYSFSRKATCPSPSRRAVCSINLGSVRSGVIVNSPCGWLSAGGIQVLVFSKISLNDGRGGLGIGGSSLGDFLAEVEHGDPIRNIHHDAHIVLDENARHAPASVFVDVQDEAHHIFDFFQV